jgi:hypothetical protein
MSNAIALREPCEITDLKTGEIVDIANATMERVAELSDNMAAVRHEIGEVIDAISTELLARLDKQASWTVRVGDPATVQWEITAPSPKAGTDVYPEDLLEEALTRLIAEGVIATEAATKACKRQLILTVNVPWSARPQDMARILTDALKVSIAGVSVEVVKAESYVRPVAQGIAAVRKVEGTVETLDVVRRLQLPSSRRVKVTRKAKA